MKLLGLVMMMCGMVQASCASSVAEDIVGNYVPSGSYLCYTDVNKIEEAMMKYRASKTKEEADKILEDNYCRYVFEEEELSYKIVKHLNHRSFNTRGNKFETEFWFTFIAIDGDGDEVPGFIGIDTD